MGTDTAIGWTDHTFNPWMGCTKVSPACDHCYAEAISKRTGKAQWGDDADRIVTSEAYWRNPHKWNREAAAGTPGPNTGRPDHLVFCASMADVFEARSDLDATRERLWALIDSTRYLTWLLLTKRPEQVMRRVPVEWAMYWPKNVWIGTTVEDQERADLRIPYLAEIPAPVRFLSCEPLLGPVDLLNHADAVQWVIAGGESGVGHRPLDLDSVRSLRQQCQRSAIPFFFKQVGGRTPTAGGNELDGRTWHEFPPGVPSPTLPFASAPWETENDQEPGLYYNGQTERPIVDEASL